MQLRPNTCRCLMIVGFCPPSSLIFRQCWRSRWQEKQNFQSPLKLGDNGGIFQTKIELISFFVKIYTK
uniref:Uncharacterized protein n=1 Tax=Moorena producens (strain JHB) TaxID=1454205 RepID=A0A1D9G7I3_MOOP1